MIAIVLAVLIALLDTGINADHPHFANTVIAGDVIDACGHGTALAGVIVDYAPRAELLSIDIDTNCRSSIYRTDFAIREAVDAGANIIVLAWSVTPDQIAGALEYATEHGAAVVMSYGLESTRHYAPNVDGGYKWRSGTSVMAAVVAGQMAWQMVGVSLYLPMVIG